MLLWLPKLQPRFLNVQDQGGLPGWLAALKTDKIAAIAAYEPGSYLFPEGELPEPLTGRTGSLSGAAVSPDDFAKLMRIPIIIYFGDYIPAVEDISDNLGAENWRTRLELGRRFVETVKKHGGDAELIELPKIGIYGNTHFLFAEKNNVQLADHLSEWLKRKSLD